MTTGDRPIHPSTVKALDELLDHIRQLGVYAEQIRTSILALEAREQREMRQVRLGWGQREPLDREPPTIPQRRPPQQLDNIRLTPRQRQVLELLVQGSTNRRIGRVLEITEQTVKAHLYVLYQKLGAADRTEAVLIALRSGMARLPKNDIEYDES